MDVESLLWLSIRDSRRIIVTVNDEPMGELADECQIVRLSRDSDSFSGLLVFLIVVRLLYTIILKVQLWWRPAVWKS